MQNAFESWIGQEVVVQLGFGQIKVSLRGVLLREQAETLLMRPDAGTDIEFAKTKVLAVEEVESSLARRAFSANFFKKLVDQDISAQVENQNLRRHVDG